MYDAQTWCKERCVFVDSIFGQPVAGGQIVGTAQTDVSRKKKQRRGVSYFAPYPTIPTPGLRQANIWIKMYKS